MSLAAILAQTEGQGFTDWVNSEAGRIENTILICIVVAAIACVFMVYVKTKAFVATISAMVLAGGVVWGTNNVDWFHDKFENEANQSGAPAIVRVVDTPPSASA